MYLPNNSFMKRLILRPNYVAPYNGFIRCYGAFSSHRHEHWGKPLFLFISALGSFKCITQRMGPMALRPILRTKHWLSVMAGDSNPHSADQEHQSLNSVLLMMNIACQFARPQLFQLVHNAFYKRGCSSHLS